MPAEPPVKLKDITLLGKEHLPDDGGYLLLPNQLGYHDLLRLQVVLADKPLIFVTEGAGLHPQLKAHLEKEGITTLMIVPETTDVSSYRSALKDAARNGSVIIYLPGQASTVNAPLTTIPGDRLDFLVKADIPVVPCYVQHTRDISISIDRRHPEAEIILAFGHEDLASHDHLLLDLVMRAHVASRCEPAGRARLNHL
jgi:acyl-[acyl-carrier-protein]-phospholipid O-acyltransferase/long-chain-fatty-acid--[acyl-carrier-protein] ligase